MARHLLAPLLLLTMAAASPANDEAAIRAAEQIWHGSGTADAVAGILADDFVRPMPSGEMWDKARQVGWLRERAPPAGFTGKIERLDLRLYGKVGVATGVALVLDPAGKEVDRTIFTDVYAKRGGRWQMVSAQRGAVARPANR